MIPADTMNRVRSPIPNNWDGAKERESETLPMANLDRGWYHPRTPKRGRSSEEWI